MSMTPRHWWWVMDPRIDLEGSDALRVGVAEEGRCKRCGGKIVRSGAIPFQMFHPSCCKDCLMVPCAYYPKLGPVVAMNRENGRLQIQDLDGTPRSADFEPPGAGVVDSFVLAFSSTRGVQDEISLTMAESFAREIKAGVMRRDRLQ